MPDSSISKTANVPLHHHLRKIFQLLHKEQNPPDQLRDIDRGGNIVVHALIPVFIFRGKVVVLGEDKERQNRQMSAKCYNGQKIFFSHFSAIAVQNNNSIIGSYQRFINAATVNRSSAKDS